MLTVEDYAIIRTAKGDGMSIRAICQTYHHSHHTVHKALNNPEPVPYTRTKRPRAPILGPFVHIIDRILLDDESQPARQRHKATKIYRRLRDEYGYKGGYDQVRRYVKKHRKKERETFIPLVHDPGQRLEADSGHIHVDFPNGRKRVPVLLATWSHSGFRFAMPLPTERLECILTGLVNAFEFFGCVPRQLWWDNPKTVVTEIFKGRRRTTHPRYAALASHYMVEPLFCMPARANEKPYVENSVFDLQRDWATPVPKVKNYDELNEYLRQCCLKKLSHRQAGKTETIGERFEQDKAVAGALPKHRFDPCVAPDAKVDKYQTVRFETNRYSVPRRWAFETVTVKAYPFHIRIVASDLQIALHRRCYLRNQQILDPMHYLAVLGRRPAALDHSGVFRHWQLPACFNKLRELFEHRHGPFAGARQYIRILQLLAEHPVRRIQKAIELYTGASRTANTLKNRIKQAAFPAYKDFESYDFTVMPSLNKQKVLELSRCEWIDKKDNCCLIGSPGTGKTHLAIALGLAACRQGRKVRFFTAASLVNRLEELRKQYQLERFLTQLDKADLLICDELGYLTFSRTGAELLFQVFADRYERGSLLITSNLAFSEWVQVFQGERMTAALLDRLTHHCHIFEMNGESYRFKQSVQKGKSKKN